MRKRAFLGLLGGAAAWPLAAGAEQGERVRRIGVLMNLAETDEEGRARVAEFHQGMKGLGWDIGRNLLIDHRWGAGDTERYRRFAAELVALGPDVIVTGGGAIAAAQQATRSIPIVFVNVTDPVGAGFVATLARPGGNTTGFSLFEYSISGKWLELLKQIAPDVTRAAVLRDTVATAGIGQFAAIQAVAPSFGVELTPLVVRDAADIEQAIVSFARGSREGLILTTGSVAQVHRELILGLALRYRLPTIYPLRHYVTGGGLISYGPNSADAFRRAAAYVDRILKGENPADLPVQAPTKYSLVINLKTARALGLDVPSTLLARADEVIE